MDSQEGIRSIVYDVLSSAEYAAYEIQVGVDNCIVHLAGSVPDLRIRDQIEYDIAKIHGVRGVVNRIDAPGSPPPGRTIDLNLKPGNCL